MRIGYSEEKRLAVVMYGGVSLAIYICGVAKELLGLVRATSPAPGDRTTAGLADPELSGTERIYRELASKPEGQERVLTTRVTIDIISGTSAGGINGVFLAKALAHDLELDPIIDLWVQSGDLALLLNDPQSATASLPPPVEPPASLLNGEHMYRRLLDAFDRMEKTPATPSRFEPCRIDLFVTATDFHGELIRLPVSNALAFEKRHRQRFHFTARPEDAPASGEFSRKENPLLAFAARCTSSFPAAFEAFTWNDALAVETERSGADPWTDRLLFAGQHYEQRPLIDGGVLDNKPFSHALDELARRQSDLPVKRSLIYVEPDPGKFDVGRLQSSQTRKPDAIESALAALTLPADETIREDLERVLARNAHVRQLERYEKFVEDELGAQPLTPFSAEAWKQIDRKALITRYGIAYGAYHHLKVESVIASIADAFAAARKIPTAEQNRVVQELTERWVRKVYGSFTGELALLLDADIDFRLRKFSFVLRRLGTSPRDATEPDVVAARRALKEASDLLYRARSVMRGVLSAELLTMRRTDLSDDVLARVAEEEGPVQARSLRVLAENTNAAAARALASAFRPLTQAHQTNAEKILEALEKVPRARTLYERYEYYDMVTWPLAHNGGLDEAVEVDVLRISPDDIQRPRREPLAGNSLAHFGAFLEEQRRHHDVLCGRLDAAEIVIRMLTNDAELANAKTTQAHQEIVGEMLKDFLVKRAVKQKTPLGPEILKVLDDKAGLLDLFQTGDAYDLGLDTAAQVDSMGRAGIIVEKMVRGWAQKREVKLPGVVRWGVLGLAMLGNVAIPRSLARTVATAWGRVLLLIFSIIGLAGFLSGQDAVTVIGLKGLGLLVSLGLARMLISTAIGDRGSRYSARVLSWATPLALALGAVWFIVKKPNTAGLMKSVSAIDAFLVLVIGLLVLVACIFADWLDLKRAWSWLQRRKTKA